MKMLILKLVFVIEQMKHSLWRWKRLCWNREQHSDNATIQAAGEYDVLIKPRLDRYLGTVYDVIFRCTVFKTRVVFEYQGPSSWRVKVTTWDHKPGFVHFSTIEQMQDLVNSLQLDR